MFIGILLWNRFYFERKKFMSLTIRNIGSHNEETTYEDGPKWTNSC